MKRKIRKVLKALENLIKRDHKAKISRNIKSQGKRVIHYTKAMMDLKSRWGKSRKILMKIMSKIVLTFLMTKMEIILAMKMTMKLVIMKLMMKNTSLLFLITQVEI